MTAKSTKTVEAGDDPMTAAYPVRLAREADGHVHAYARDLPQAVASGADDQAALAEAADALGASVEFLIERGDRVPAPSPAEAGERLVPLPAEAAAKLLVWAAWRSSGLSKSGLAEKLDAAENEARRILDPKHGTRLAKMDAAARAMGKRLVLSIESA